MPYTTSSGGAKIYYEVRGSGPPLVLIEGLGYASWMWTMQTDDLSKDHKLIIFDNRGVGKSDKPNYPYTINMFSDDLKAVLDSTNEMSAHILGVSMGGMIAQEFALRHPERVRSLILVSTHHGGPDVEPAPQDVLQAMFGEPPPDIKSEKELYIYKMSYAFAKGWIEKNRKLLEKIIELRLKEIPPWEAYMNQVHAAVTFNASKEVSKINKPVLIIHGEQDRVVPVSNALKLHSKIKNSMLIILKNTGHLLIIERAKDFNNLVREFVKNVEKKKYVPKKKPLYI